MKNERLIKNIIENKGATLTSELQNANLNKGYMVSIPNYERVVSLDSLSSVEEIESTLNEYKTIAKKNNAFIGCWVYENNLYINLSKNYKRLKNAIRIGKQNAQLGIYDLSINDTILL